MAPFFPLVCGKLIIHLQTHNHSLLHFLGTSTHPHGTVMAIYPHTRACSLIYVCVDMKAAGDRVATGREDGGESRSEKQRGRGIMGEFAAGIRSFTSDGEPGDVPS